jgi:hypothetical protein
METAMNTVTIRPLPRLRVLPTTLPLEGAVRIELEEGVPVFRASDSIQARIEELLFKQREAGLTVEEKEEFDRYEEIDDYLSFVNRVIRNLI